jgi:hypothetical protein
MIRSLTAVALGLLMLGSAAARADDNSFDHTKDKYVSQAREQMDEWRHKLDELSDKANTQAHTTTESARGDIDAAWRRAQAEEKHLEGASEDGWAHVRSSFEKASQDLKDTWNRNVGSGSSH